MSAPKKRGARAAAGPNVQTRKASRKGGSVPFGSWLVLLLLLVALGLELGRSRNRLRASAILWRTEGVARAAVASGRAPRELLSENLHWLRKAEKLDPVEVALPLARGTHHLLLGSGEAAMDAYSDALRLEPRPEIYLNLGRAQRLAGQSFAAEQSFATAVQLDPNLAPYVPRPNP